MTRSGFKGMVTYGYYSNRDCTAPVANVKNEALKAVERTLKAMLHGDELSRG